MIYFGVDLNYEQFTIAALSEGFAFLGQKYFHFSEHDDFTRWVDGLKCEPHEICWWFFDEAEFNKLDDPGSIFPINEENYDCSNFIYLINHRKVLNLTLFFHEWFFHRRTFFSDLEKAYVLASSVRIFDKEFIMSNV